VITIKAVELVEEWRKYQRLVRRKNANDEESSADPMTASD
jgi:hypothetical protein